MVRIILSTFLFFYVLSGNAQERILNYDVKLEVLADADMLVTENIKVLAQGVQIRRGIYREIPLYFENPDGRRVYLEIDVLSLERNNEEEPYDVNKSGNKVRIDFGNDDFISKGEHSYSLKYKVKGIVGYFEHLDELYWNATGNEWSFQIDATSVQVIIPSGAKIIQTAGYSGEKGQASKDFEIETDSVTAVFKSTKVYKPGEGLTVGVGWSKGFVAEPSPQDRNALVLSRQIAYIFSFILLVLMFIYLFWAWKKVGVDPKKGTIIPQFDPPEGLAPGDCRYIYRHINDNKTMVADLIDLAVKGLIKIENNNKNFTLSFIKDADNIQISIAQQSLLSQIKSKPGIIALKKSNGTFISKLMSKHGQFIKKTSSNVFFKRNGWWTLPAFIILVLGLGYLLIKAPLKFNAEDGSAIFAIFSLIFLIAGSSTFFQQFLSYRDNKSGLGSVIGSVFFMVISLGIWAFFIGFFYLDFLLIFLLGVGFIFTFSLFSQLMLAPTEKGREVIDYLEGLKMFMEKAEQYRFDALQDPTKGLQLFEELLPYAIAMGVENKWGKSFDSVVQKALTMESSRSQSRLSSGAGTHFGASAISSALSSSLASSISSSTASSSSGSGGGGSSGGGGGGGGGGGR